MDYTPSYMVRMWKWASWNPPSWSTEIVLSADTGGGWNHNRQRLICIMFSVSSVPIVSCKSQNLVHIRTSKRHSRPLLCYYTIPTGLPVAVLQSSACRRFSIVFQTIGHANLHRPIFNMSLHPQEYFKIRYLSSFHMILTTKFRFCIVFISFRYVWKTFKH